MVGDCSDQQGQKCLNKFLTVLRSRHCLFSYVWVAERQQNGRIHFHLIVDRRSRIRSVNKLWVLQQYNAGIKNLKLDYSAILTAYAVDNLHRLLNPVDIKRVRDITALSGYLTQYITKNKDHFSCAVWHCNRYVSALFTSTLINDKDFAETGTSLNSYTSKKGKNKGKKFENKTFIVTDKVTGKTLVIVNNIFNKEYFSKHFEVMNDLNRMIIQQCNERKLNRSENIFKRFKFTQDDFVLDGCEWLN
jgi:ribosomal protein L20